MPVSVEIEGRLGSRLKRELVTSLSCFVVKKYLPKRSVDVTYRFMRKMQNNVEGMCHNLQVGAKRPSVFEIEILNELSTMSTLVTAAHEMVHVLQYASGRLAMDAAEAVHKWEGVPHVWEPEETDPFASDSYWDLPWEIEAHGRQHGLVFMWMKANSFDKSERWYERVG